MSKETFRDRHPIGGVPLRKGDQGFVDIHNKYYLGLRGDKIVMPLPPAGLMSKEEALVLAAWLVMLADDDDQFKKILAMVRES